MIGANFVFSTEELQNTMTRVVAATVGVKPKRVRDSQSARRFNFGANPGMVLFNKSSAELLRTLCNPVVGMMLPVDNTAEAARVACQIFQEASHTAMSISRAEPEFPEGFLVFVVVPDLNGIVLVFCPKTPDPAMLAQIPADREFVDADVALPSEEPAA